MCRLAEPHSIDLDHGLKKSYVGFCIFINLGHSLHLQSDGLSEHFNRTFFVEDNQLNWDAFLPYVMLDVHASTSFTLYIVLFGQEIVLPVDIMLNIGICKLLP